MRKFISLVLTALLAANLGTSVMAADKGPLITSAAPSRDYTEAEAAASELKELGLFKGVSDTDCDLDRAPTRTEAMVMLIRILGKEAEALDGDFNHPFTDVAEWADPYIGYAYENKLTNGISPTEFGASDASAEMYLTFVLRALGYSDAGNADFAWDAPFELAKETGILTDNVNTDEFFRADVAIVSNNALEAELKDSDTTLAEKLISDGVFTADDYAKATMKAPEAVKPADVKYNYLTDFTGYNPDDMFDDNGYIKGLKATDYVDLTDYKNFPDAESFFEFDEDTINKAIAEYFPIGNSYEKITDRIPAKGDMINTDITLSISALGMELASQYLGNTNLLLDEENAKENLGFMDFGEYAEAFGLSEEELEEKFTEFMHETVNGGIGCKRGETYKASINITADVGMGAPVEITVTAHITVNYICGEVIPTEYTDELAKSLGFDSFEALCDRTVELLTEAGEAALFAEILVNCKCDEVPKEVMESYINMSLYAVYLVSSYADEDFDLEEFVTSDSGYESLDEFVADIAKDIEPAVKESIIIQAIAETEGIVVTDEDLEAYPYISIGGKNAVLIQLVMEYIVGIYE